MKIKKLTISDNRLTERLSTIHKPPKTLFTIGTLPEFPKLVVSIVGSRRPTAYGRSVTSELSAALASRGAVIVSGLALGIDAIAHQACLDAGGTTIAVLAGGVDDPTPKTNIHLARAILQQGGALISEYENGTQPRQYMFLERNRIVSGLADILIVTEANIRSGTLSTVAHALEQGKNVYAVPGPITSPLSAGCNALIAQGARPIISIDAFIAEVFANSEGRTTATPTHRGDTTEEQIIIDLLVEGISDGDELLEKSTLDQSVFASTMTMLELKTIVKPLGNNKWSL